MFAAEFILLFLLFSISIAFIIIPNDLMNSGQINKGEFILSIGDISVKPGRKIRQHILIDIGTKESPIPVQIPLSLINGHRSGPTLTLWAGVHGGEFVSIQTLAILAEQIDPMELKGRLILVHVANPPASFNGRMSVSPLDGININRVFPGNKSGKPTERIAAWLFENTLPKANYFMDLHSGGIDETLHNFVTYRNCTGSPKVDTKARQLALSLGMEDLLLTKDGPKGGFSHAACTRIYGIPSLLVETGQLGQRDLDTSKCLLFRLFRALRHLEMLDYSSKFSTPPSDCQTTNNPREWIGNASLASNHTGFWYREFENGDEIKIGQKLGEVKDAANGTLLEEILSPVNGKIFYAQNGLTVAKGTELVAIATANNNN